jgi:chromosome segregation ATPase
MESAKGDAAEEKRRADDADKQLAEEKQKSKRLADELVSAKEELQKTSRDATAGKAVTTEAAELREKLAATEAEFQKAQEEASSAKTGASANPCRSAALQELQKRPPVGSSMIQGVRRRLSSRSAFLGR